MARKAFGNEVRNSRISLLATQKLADDMQTLAAINGKTLNDFICFVLEEVATHNRAIITEYRDTLADMRKKFRQSGQSDKVNINDVKLLASGK